ncbi:hypothetical protein RO3G_16621 [Lichtheimia corymbifera JMRC:FSU:9682]|uniref:HMG box domain-containing protein n=1 Tax=Lichtheimia corymbifera JMRC:FSU:9682 TaxID=1263082 RepID=A0A068SFV7_9FUNG|nr:hypothetical protein RO3G_16621 [Lichtheimia corymbifera JMRC:FSU:9682]
MPTDRQPIMNNTDPASSTNTTSTPVTTTTSDDTLRQKYNLLKKRVREIEEDNDAIHLKLTKAMRQIKRLRVERIVLLEELDQSRRRDGKRVNAASSDSEGEVSDSGLAISLKTSNASNTTGRKRGGPGKSRAANSKQPQERKKRDPNAPKGPGNVFFLYCRMERDNIKDQLTSDNLGEATRLLGQKWKALSKEEKQVYYDMYNKEQKEFEQAMELYNASGGSGGGANSTNNNGTDSVKEEEIDMLPDESRGDESSITEPQGPSLPEPTNTETPNSASEEPTTTVPSSQ